MIVESTDGEAESLVDAPSRMASASCCLCESDAAEPIAVGEDFQLHESSETFLALRCLHCGLIYLNPRPTVASPTVASDDSALTTASREDETAVGLRISSTLLKHCYPGSVADAAILCIGCDPSTIAASTGHTTNRGQRIDGLTIDEALDPSALAGEGLDDAHPEYDLVILQHAIERQESPYPLLRAARELVRRGGRIAVITPNIDSSSFRLFGGRHWAGYDFPRHLALFGPTQLRAIAAATHLEVVSIFTMPGADIWLRSARNALADWGASESMRRLVEPRKRVASVIFGAMESVARLRDRGAWLVAVLQRPV